MSEILGGSVGPEANYKAEIVNKKLVITVDYKGEGGAASLNLSFDLSYALDRLAQTIPGEIDNIVIKLVKESLLK